MNGKKSETREYQYHQDNPVLHFVSGKLKSSHRFCSVIEINLINFDPSGLKFYIIILATGFIRIRTLLCHKAKQQGDEILSFLLLFSFY